MGPVGRNGKDTLFASPNPQLENHMCQIIRLQHFNSATAWPHLDTIPISNLRHHAGFKCYDAARLYFLLGHEPDQRPLRSGAHVSVVPCIVC